MALGAGALWLVVLTFALGLRADLGLSPLLFVHVGVPALLGAAALFAALAPGRVGLGPSAGVTLALALASPAAFALTAALFPALDGGHSLQAAFFCGDVALALGAVPLAALAWAQRATCVVGAPLRSAMLGVAMGLLGAATLGMHCGNGDGLHVAIGHGWPVIVLGVAGALLVGRVTRVAASRAR